ncbi:BamA/TamA family outer membrane protein [Candidatus Dependentiae bacterium]
MCKFKRYLVLAFFLLFEGFTINVIAQVQINHQVDCQVDHEELQKSCIVITLPSELDSIENKAIENKIKDAVPDSFEVKQLSFESDITFEKKEFLYLVGFQEGDKIGFKDLQYAVSCLIRKNKFEKIMIAICPQEGGKRLHFALTGSWTFRKIKVHGIWVGRYEYSKYYTMEPGDKFNKEKHNHAINKLKILLKTQGYFSSSVSSDIAHNKETKTVQVDLFLDRKKRFSIGGVKFFVKNASNKKIERIEGLEDKINNLFIKNFAKNVYSKSLINKETRSLKRYLSKKGFLHIDIELVEKINYRANTVDLKFIITAYSKKEFIFFGNTFFDDAKLREKILLYGRSAWLVPASLLSGEILKQYENSGFFDVSIETREEDRGCFFIIKEGARASVGQVKINGVKSFEHDFLIQTCFSQFLRAKYFDQGLLDRALSKLLTLYLQAGFWDIKILKQDFKKREDTYTFVVSIDEGARSYLKSVSFSGLDGIANARDIFQAGPFQMEQFKTGLRNTCDKKDFGKKEGEDSEDNTLCKTPFDIGILTKQKNWLVNYFKDKGYLHTDVSPELTREDQDVSLVWVVSPGELVTFGKTIVLGSGDFPIDYIMRELRYRQGDSWDNEKLKESVKGLRSLGIFESTHLFAYSQHGQMISENHKDIFLKINHADPYEIRTRVGLARYGIDKCYFFGQGFTYKLGGAFLWKNPLKKAGRLMLDFDVALSYRNFCIDYAIPWIFGYPIKTTFKVYANRYEQPGFICSKKNLYQAKQDGFLIGFNRVYKKVNASFNVGVEWLETSIKRNMTRVAKIVSQAINFDSCLLGKKIPYFLVEPTVLINTVDDKQNPRSGFFTLLTLKGMFPLKREFSNSYFIKFMAEQSIFHALGPNFVGALRLRLGHVFNRCFKDIAPIERFYLGGAHSVRGYEKDMCPPLGMFCDKNKDFQDNTKSGRFGKCGKSGNLVVAPQGGKTMLNINAEARFYFYKSLTGVLFQDVGVLAGDKLNKSYVSPATGFGVRFNTALGPIRFDLGFKWRVRNKFESRYAWFLAFGNAF